jgi:HAD superfamily hydrolase (TIGR01484 family)
LKRNLSFKIWEGKKIIVADLDGTIAPSKSAVENEMSEILTEFLKYKKLAIISGGRYEQFQKQILSGITKDPELLKNLYLFPTCATALYIFKSNEWRNMYSHYLKKNEKERIFSAFDTALKFSNYKKPEKNFGEIIEDRKTQITFSALGQEAPLELKKVWDPDKKKRKIIIRNLKKIIPEFEIRFGGTTSIDVTRKGIDKAYGIRKISEYFNYKIQEMLFIGDELIRGGNDYPVRSTGIDYIEVKNPSDTEKIFRSIIDFSSK